MYRDVKTKYRCTSGMPAKFPIEIEVHQGSVCRSLLFNVVMNYPPERLTDETNAYNVIRRRYFSC